MRRVLQELQLMDADVKRKQARTRGLLALPPTPRPLALPFGPGEVLDLTYSPPAQAFPAPSPFTFPALGPGPGGLSSEGNRTGTPTHTFGNGSHIYSVDRSSSEEQGLIS